jgi:hypothetical protein
VPAAAHQFAAKVALDAQFASAAIAAAGRYRSDTQRASAGGGHLSNQGENLWQTCAM